MCYFTWWSWNSYYTWHSSFCITSLSFLTNRNLKFSFFQLFVLARGLGYHSQGIHWLLLWIVEFSGRVELKLYWVKEIVKKCPIVFKSVLLIACGLGILLWNMHNKVWILFEKTIPVFCSLTNLNSKSRLNNKNLLVFNHPEL